MKSQKKAQASIMPVNVIHSRVILSNTHRDIYTHMHSTYEYQCNDIFITTSLFYAEHPYAHQIVNTVLKLIYKRKVDHNRLSHRMYVRVTTNQIFPCHSFSPTFIIFLVVLTFQYFRILYICTLRNAYGCSRKREKNCHHM